MLRRGPRACRMVRDGTATLLNCSGAGFGDGVILLSGAAADADGANDLAILAQRNSTGEDHDAAVIGDVNAEELIARLRMRRQVFGRDVEGPGRESFVDGNIDAANPGSVHSNVGHQVAAPVDYGDVHRLTDLLSLLLRGGDDSASCFEIHDLDFPSVEDEPIVAVVIAFHACRGQSLAMHGRSTSTK